MYIPSECDPNNVEDDNCKYDQICCNDNAYCVSPTVDADIYDSSPSACGKMLRIYALFIAPSSSRVSAAHE